MVMVIYHYVEIIWRILVTPNFFISYIIEIQYYPGGPVNIHMQSLINFIQDKNWLIPTKKGKGKLPSFRGNADWSIPIYGGGGCGVIV